MRAGLWAPFDGGWQFHNWGEFQPSSEDVRATREARAEAGRRGGKRSGESRRAKQAGSNGEANASANGEAQGKQKRPPSPSPSPSPSSVVTTTCQSSPLTREHDDGPVDNSSTADLDGINVYAVQRSVAEHVGVSIDVFMANRLAGDIITKSTEPVKRPTAYVQTAIRNEPEQVRAFLAEVAA